ncbi:Eco57I restriction-modification methylase domain-containing protein [Planktothrix agardhii 1806]|uniref:class I SAM-dependent DNA methyltransferase n=1 Tax=Planktothrix agardhii TaxID=1160 RepID=UPI001F421369|nr:TaqI-like C-terminal specificity domain-containing protein [Planktothrix agardhii]MCF3604281.1 Eco57I restriction-modification methylase domain-containing protein [Planktothrix agardhii 1804]MCF3614913.1 Eco57I restriction-modification methylase domain-containing protein [Planktothrix agardhii 1806]
MNNNQRQPREALNKAFLKVKVSRSNIEQFKTNLINLLEHINEKESEEFHKNLMADFLKNTYYSPNYFINTRERNDLVIHNQKDSKSSVGVILEVKKPKNKAEMVKVENLNAKALQELVLYFLRERITNNNLEIKHLIATNINEWFIFDAQIFEKYFCENKQLIQQFEDFTAGRLTGKTTDFFYKEIAKPAIEKIKNELQFTYFNIQDYEAFVRDDNPENDEKLIALFKLLSPQHLLKLPTVNDSNTLDKGFYSELLYLIGLTETKEKNKKLIKRQLEAQRNPASLLENAILQLDSLDKISRLEKPEQFGETAPEQVFNIALELSITWINRILFLKLLESQLITYHKGDRNFAFLNLDKIHNFDDLERLFFQVLAVKSSERKPDVKKIFSQVPYLNSSLFEPTELEHQTLVISNLRAEKLPILSTTVLKDPNGNKRTGELNTLQYLFEFLDAYDFSSEGLEGIQEEQKTLINASVLGLIFEKINGYKDGSYFTPGFITMYMCRETLRKAVVQKFNEIKSWNCQTLDDLYDKIEDRNEANQIINSLKICDPAVGSGHFLVSALNEIIAIKNDLKILQDQTGKRLKEYQVIVENDELIITDEDHQPFTYTPKNQESQRIQETLFHEKQTIIENCLLGVDINPNSVKICRLRLWIELLKNAYYKVDSNYTELETLPNIDINIKCGNSLISRFPLDADLKPALKKSGIDIETYQNAVQTYRHADNKQQKREMERLINSIKSNFKTTLQGIDPRKTKLRQLEGEVYNLENQLSLFEETKTEQKAREKKVIKLNNEMEKLRVEIEEIESGKIYDHAFEWRFEFPEILDDEGKFIGFDVVIGNPPYFSLSKIKEKYQTAYFENNYQTYTKVSDIYCLFYEKGNCVLRKRGFLAYITSNSWLKTIYGDSLKKYFIENMQPQTLLNIEDIQIFEEATVESNIIILKKDKVSEYFDVASLTNNYLIGSSLDEYFDKNCFQFKIPSRSEWIIGNIKTTDLKLRIEQSSKLLKEFDININRGLLTGLNAAFIINEETKNQLIYESSNSAEIIQPILRGRDLKKYSYDFSGFYLINTHNGIVKKNIERIKVQEDYPFIYDYLLSFLPQIEQRQDHGKHWTNLRNCAYLEDFKKPKIVWGEISDKPKFAFDDSNYYAEVTTFLMTGEKLKYLLAILNSRLSEWYFNQISTTTGMGTNRWKKYKIEMLPIKEPTETEELLLEKLVNQILTAKQSNPNADTTILEQQIDQLVYELYGLTEEEIKIVEGKT